MNTVIKNALAVAAVAIATQAVAQVTLYEQNGFQGRSFTTERQLGNLERNGFNDRASSVEVVGDRWEVCEDVRFNGRCAVLRPGRYPSLDAMGLNDRVSSVRAVRRGDYVDDRRYAPMPAPAPAPVPGQVTFYEREGFGGRSFTTDRPIDNFERLGFNDRASSIDVVGQPWEVCEEDRFNGRCAVLRPGRYPTLTAMGLDNRISSVRHVNQRGEEPRYVPAPVAVPDYRRRNDERLYEANVTSVRAVLGAPEQRCWVEREQVVQERGAANVPGAIAGAIIGGILGHQVGGGTGKDLATVGGVVAGAAVGANVGRGDAAPAPAQNVQRCENVPSQAQPQYWDVSYNFRGQEHRIQMTSPPGATVTVNERGEPRR
ncbi:beta/gamma crystallin-related protein [Rhodoferax ferrireducens]|uniref:beta/gamma crystallin-related protein n=1 Tax=Rhodoferax ferrireducens TaxID=192843 RepID=UPI000E0DA3B4|nr:beta/gamma crystallin-related protein [Rhodoferax ferrireducens]